MRAPKWEPDTPLNKQVQSMFGRKRTKQGFGRYTAKEYRKAIAAMRPTKQRKVKKDARKKKGDF